MNDSTARRARLIGGLTLCSLGGLAWFQHRGDDDGTAVGDVEEHGVATSLSLESNPVDARRQLIRVPIPDQAPKEDTVPVTFRGRCIAREDLRPLAACLVTLRGFAGSLDAARAETVWIDPPPVTTTNTGTFEFTIAPPPGYRVNLEIRAPGRVYTGCNVAARHQGVVRDLGDISLHRASRVRLRVMDENGRPRPGVLVSLVGRRPSVSSTGLREYWPRRGRSDADGIVRLTHPVPEGSWRVELAETPPTSAPDQIVIDGDELEMEFEIGGVRFP